MKQLGLKIKNWLQKVTAYAEYRYASKQAKAGNKYGQFLLAKMYETGTAYVSRNRVGAYVMYWVAYYSGIQQAKQRLDLLESKLLTGELEQAQRTIKRLQNQIEVYEAKLKKGEHYV